MSATVAQTPGPTLLSDERRPPTVADAQRVADAFAEDRNVVKVLLFGSVARGTARADSDIDLMVVYADIDYSCRSDVAIELFQVADSLVRSDVDVHVTDVPEWSIRKKLVANSLEADLNRLPLVPLVDRPVDVSAVDWGKEQIMPTDNLTNAVDALDAWVGDELQTLALKLRVDDVARDVLGRRRRGRSARLLQTVANAAMVVEKSIKVLAMLRAVGEPLTDSRLRRAGHAVEDCLQLLDEPYRGLFAGLVVAQGIKPADFGLQRTAPYEAAKRSATAERLAAAASRRAADYVTTALTVSDAVIEQFERRLDDRTAEQFTAAAVTVSDVVLDAFEEAANGNKLVADTREQWEFLKHTYETIDVFTGELREVPLDLAPMLEAQRRRVREVLAGDTSGDTDAADGAHPAALNGSAASGRALGTDGS